VNSHFYSLAALSLAVVLMAGCAGASPPVDLYTLSALERSAGQTELDKSEKPLAIVVGPASFPESLDRPQIVTRKGPNRLHANEFQRWGGPLQENFLRVLGENLSILLATSRVVVFPADAPFPVDFRVLLQVQQFEGSLGKEAVLNARWSVSRTGDGDRAVRVVQSLIREPVASAGYEALVAAESKVLTALSREIAETISSLAKR
jgi:uncharacterized lipoprotein YmbA